MGRQGARPDGRPRRPRHDPGGALRHGRQAPERLVRVSAQRGQARPEAEHPGQEGRPDAGPGTLSKRVLITGLSTYWGGRLAQALEQDPEIETVIGVDRRPPKVELERTEWVEVADSHSLIRRIVQGAEIDTVVDTRLVVDSVVTSQR